jgi:hypothetical protein
MPLVLPLVSAILFVFQSRIAGTEIITRNFFDSPERLSWDIECRIMNRHGGIERIAVRANRAACSPRTSSQLTSTNRRQAAYEELLRRSSWNALRSPPFPSSLMG